MAATFHPTRRGLTIIEMSIALMITTLVVGSLSAVLMATSRAWAATEEMTNTQLAGSQLSQQMQRRLREAHWIGVIETGSIDGSKPGAQVMLWREDAWPVTRDVFGTVTEIGDGVLDLAEVALIEHDPATRRILLYAADFPAYYTQEQREQMTADLNEKCADPASQFGTAKFAQDFKKELKNLGLNPRPLTPAAVKGAVFAERGTAPGSAQRPSMEYVLRINRAGDRSADEFSAGDRIDFGTATLRGPMLP